jgi:hypothetical protein
MLALIGLLTMHHLGETERNRSRQDKFWCQGTLSANNGTTNSDVN